ARLDEQVLVRQREREARVHEAARTGHVAARCGRGGFLVLRFLLRTLGGFLLRTLGEHARELAIDELLDLRFIHPSRWLWDGRGAGVGGAGCAVAIAGTARAVQNRSRVKARTIPPVTAA